MLVDSHCHLDMSAFRDDLDAVLLRAREGGVRIFLTIGTSLSEVQNIQKLADTYDDVYCTVGLHPHGADQEEGEGLYDRITAAAHHPKVLGIGETGLDYHYENSSPFRQKQSFETHIQVSIDLTLPLVIHTRKADEDTLSLLRGNKGATGVFHCFSGDKTLAKSALDLGFYLSFSGILTFKKAEDLREVARYVPLDRILIETDSPFLAPIPHRGQRNEPAFVKYTALTLSSLKGISYEDVVNQTTENFFSLFKPIDTFSD